MTLHKFATVNDRQVFYREAGDPTDPTILLLHGFPTSSFMFRDLIPLLAELRGRGSRPPRFGMELKDARGRPSGGVVEMFWPDRKVGVYLEDDLYEAELKKLRASGWTLVAFPCAAEDIPL